MWEKGRDPDTVQKAATTLDEDTRFSTMEPQQRPTQLGVSLWVTGVVVVLVQGIACKISVVITCVELRRSTI